jgi:hypothetical protein
MIELIIFHLHIIAAVYVFVKYWQVDELKNAFLGIAILGLLFTIGWALSSAITAAIYPDSWNSIYFNSDTFSLVLLAIPESIFFYYYFYKDK